VISRIGGSYEVMINNVLRQHIFEQHEPLEDTLRRVLFDEMVGWLGMRFERRMDDPLEWVSRDPLPVIL